VTTPRKRHNRESPRDELLVEWIGEIRRCFHQLGAAATDIHRELDLTGAQRAVMESLARDGDQTVPRLARARPVSRQHIQGIVDTLAEAGLVTAVSNPRHKRSPLIHVTARGRKVMTAVFEREKAILPLLSAAFTDAELKEAVDVTARLRRLAAERPWRG